MFSHLLRLSTVLVALFALQTASVSARRYSREELKHKQREAVKRWTAPTSGAAHLRERSLNNITFKNPRASGEASLENKIK